MRTLSISCVVLTLACASEDPMSGDASTGAASSTGAVSTSGSSASTTSSGSATASASDGSTGGTTTADADASSGESSGDDPTTGWIPPADCGGGALADLAETIEVGAFVPLRTTGLTSDLIDAGGGHHILQFSDKGVWDPNTCQALFTGGGHLSETKFIAYSASENTWFQAPNPSWWCPLDPDNPYACATHAYGHNALNPETGEYWFRRFNDANVHHTQVGSPISAEWDAAPDLPGVAAGCIATALEYFPELGGLVYVDCAGQSVMVAYDGASTWETLPGTYAMGPYHNVAVYSQPLGQVLFGAGNGSYDLHLLSPDGTAESIAPPPRTFHPSPDDPSTFRILTADPISGRFLAYAPAGDLFEYDASSDAWSEVTTDAPEQLQIAIPVSTYGVVLFLSLEPTMYVYRHVAP